MKQRRAESSRSQTASAFDYLASQLTPTKEDKESNPEMAEVKSAARDTAKDAKQVSTRTGFSTFAAAVLHGWSLS